MNKILVVDDEYAIRLLYEEEFAEEGYEVITCSSSDSINRIIEGEEPDVVVLDVNMDKSSGLDILQEIRNAFSNTPIILCTAHTFPRSNLNRIPVDHVLLKSSNLNELKTRIRMALGNKMYTPSMESPRIHDPTPILMK